MTDLETFLREMGLDKAYEKSVSSKDGTNYYYLVKGYFNDPRNNNGEVPF